MPLGKNTKKQIHNTVSYISSHEDITLFKCGITRQGILNRFPAHETGDGYEHVVALADNLKCDDAIDLEKDLHEWAAKNVKTSRWNKHVYEKYVHKDKEFTYSHGPGKKSKKPIYSVYMIW